jgi:MFS family permease
LGVKPLAREPIPPEFAMLFMVMLVIGAGNTALQSVMPAIGRSLGIADSVIALAFSASALLWALAAPVWAKRSDRTGRRAMVLTGLAGFCVSVMLCAFFLTAGIHGAITPVMTILGFIAARMIYGLFGAAAPPAAQAILATRTTREQRTKALTLLASAFGLGTILGPALASYFVLPGVGLAGPAYFFSSVGFVVLAIVWWRLPKDVGNAEARGAPTSYPSIGGNLTGASVTAATAERSDAGIKLTDSRIWPWMLVGLVMGHAQAMVGQAIAFLVIDRLTLDPTTVLSQQTIGIVLTAGAAAALLVQWGVIPQLNMKPRALVLTGLLLAAVGCAMTAVSDSLYGISMAFAVACAGFGFARPGWTAGGSLAVGPELQGAVAGRTTAVNGLVFVIGPSLGVGLYEIWKPLPYLVTALACTLLAAYVWRTIARDT